MSTKEAENMSQGFERETIYMPYTVTLGQILEPAFREPMLRPTIYVVSDPARDTVFYVGTTEGWIRNRIKHHINSFSALGEAILGNWPASQDWIVQLMRSEELPGGPYVSNYHAEKAVIAWLRPCLNVDQNPNPTPLPAQYHHPELAKQQRAEMRSRPPDLRFFEGLKPQYVFTRPAKRTEVLERLRRAIRILRYG